MELSVKESYQLEEHYKIEKKLAAQLRDATTEERTKLYGELYDELFRRVPQHPMMIEKSSSDERQKEINEEFNYLKKYLNKDTSFIEIGAGDCGVSFMVADYVKSVTAIDVSEIITDSQQTPDNFKLVLTDGTSIPVEAGCTDVVYSNQLMEHLHPDDAKKQLQNIYNALTKGGIYYCQTPNRLNGPHDVSEGFDTEATCFHLKEYTTTELDTLFKEIGFSRRQVIIGARGLYLTIPTFPVKILEAVLNILPYKIHKPIAKLKLFQSVLDIRFIGTK